MPSFTTTLRTSQCCIVDLIANLKPALNAIIIDSFSSKIAFLKCNNFSPSRKQKKQVISFFPLNIQSYLGQPDLRYILAFFAHTQRLPSSYACNHSIVYQLVFFIAVFYHDSLSVYLYKRTIQDIENEDASE